MKVVLEVLSGTVPSEIGKTHHEYISYPDPKYSDEANGVRRSVIRRLFYALKLTTPEELKVNPKFRVDLQLAIGRICCGKVVHDEYNGKIKAKFFHKGGDLFASDSPKAAGIPMPAAAGAGANGNGNGQQSQHGQQTAPPAAATSSFGDGLDEMLG